MNSTNMPSTTDADACSHIWTDSMMDSGSGMNMATANHSGSGSESAVGSGCLSVEGKSEGCLGSGSRVELADHCLDQPGRW